MKDDEETPFGFTVEEIIIEVVKKYNYPVSFGFPAGHVQDNWALRFGAEISL
jgi:muramoyltetrapeptide carboxypeptidase